MKAPFPWFGGKSRVAHVVWDAFGDVPNYVEPFAGSLAVLLARPHEAHIETVNDLDCYLANFWRAMAHDPEGTARHADWPVNEADLLARHSWLMQQSEFRKHMRKDPDYYDAKIAGWWVWGLCSWIGSGFCDVDAYERRQRVADQIPHLGDAGQGINRKLPHLGDAGQGITDFFAQLSDRLRRTRVACGSWERVLTDSVTWRHGITGVFLDPPYSEGNVDYSAGGRGISAEVAEWAISNSANPLLRIALCGYEGEHEMPANWRCIRWKANGGFSNATTNNNAHRERIWLSPHCVNAQPSLFREMV